ncbi:heat shock 70 kDa protein 12A-like [Dreissena polymorpha]|uniref:Heat shock 70 kDa protein 12A n=1 Tax=Dreissena polymorpha TaxID=45954 RepID=A0A9D3YV83_DREPO|nr:heat shock 70 kDa protein 12A-like [Dreissena polymorpha]KAH3704788.1 hypothetical protein DPMN_079849 [Dreissena polymorpha]
MVLVVASIDFGTTFSGWAYSFTHENEMDPTDVKAKNWNADQFISAKAPTCVLIESGGRKVEAFGYEAENRYAELASDDEHKDWYFFKKFKMTLFINQGTIGRSTMLEDETGKQLTALTVFSLTIKHLQDDLFEALNLKMAGGISRKDIHWVLTVPAIWNDSAKQFMRMAAREAGTEMGHLNLALEPEAASIYCCHSKITKTQDSEVASIVNVSTFNAGTRYLVCDAGGGTVDVTVHEVTSDMKLKEIEKASGGAWGCTKVDEAFEKFVDGISGCSVMKKLKDSNMEDYLDIMRTFEIKKRECKNSSTGKVIIRIPSSVCDIVVELTQKTLQENIKGSSYKGKVILDRDKLKCEASVIAELFTEPVNCIVGHLYSLLSKYKNKPINHIVMVGGFSESPLLQEAIRSMFPGKHVTIPQDAGLAVMKGAVMFGHNKRQIVSRIARFTYGISVFKKTRQERIDSCFAKFVEIGQSVPTDGSTGKRHFCHKPGETTAIVPVFATKEKHPVFVHDPGSFEIGYFRINCKDKYGDISDVNLEMYFGGTEIIVKAKLDTTGEEITATFDIPD